MEKLIKASYHGSINIGEIEIKCHVLENGSRVISQRGFQKAIGMSTSGGSTGAHRIAKFVSNLESKGIKIKDLYMRIENPIQFYTAGKKFAYGYEADILTEICEFVLQCRDANILAVNQKHIATRCDILIRSFAKVGIIALIDEATGYQEIRDKKALEKILEVYITKELMRWQKRFPDEWYENLFRLKNLEWKGRGFNPPQYVGKVTNDIIYDRLPAGIKEELSKLNPPDEKGQRKHRHHQFLTNNIGHPKLQEIITGTLTLMKISPNWRVFYCHLQRAFPKFGDYIKEEK